MMYRHEDYVDAIRLVSEGKIQLKPLMSSHFAFLDYQKAYEYIDDNRETTMKVLIDVDASESYKKEKRRFFLTELGKSPASIALSDEQ